MDPSVHEKHRIVLRAQTGKKQRSEEKMRQIKEAVAGHPGVLQRGFDSSELNEDTIENIATRTSQSISTPDRRSALLAGHRSSMPTFGVRR
ncbi:TPA: hypothetical protein N0F65_004687 [Lagenidium giganteum]|uniref:Uncharacterized protein n=1 Tax=Lagenidium giganteum TaxID=4803 RepID=A0AAV2Z4W0_9STRA|nr:TPA: hypothetical protein N0F65_004687 [Lagenidium giganteum]